HRDAAVAQEFQVGGVEHGAASAGDHLSAPLTKLVEELGLDPAEVRLAAGAKDFVHRHALDLADELIDVDQRHPGTTGQLLADERLARGHESGQGQVAVRRQDQEARSSGPWVGGDSEAPFSRGGVAVWAGLSACEPDAALGEPVAGAAEDGAAVPGSARRGSRRGGGRRSSSNRSSSSMPRIALRNSRMPEPTERATSGILFAPKSIKMTKRMTTSSCEPILNIGVSARNDGAHPLPC